MIFHESRFTHHKDFMMNDRYQHKVEVLAFLRDKISRRDWELTLPASGRGHETYIAQSEGEIYFIKLGASVPNYEAMSSLDLTPAVIETGYLDDGISIMVQAYVDGENPSRHDFRQHLEKFAVVVNNTHHNLTLQAALPEVVSSAYKDVGMSAFKRIQQKWELYRPQVPTVAGYVDAALSKLIQDVESFYDSGLVASHNDICNANWLITADEKVYLIDLEAMSLDDPALDMGALLWWYYPLELRQQFLMIAGYDYEEAFRNRMRVRMALHCLNIILPRAESFDRFDADAFPDWLTDFRAIAAGKENPQGYYDD